MDSLLNVISNKLSIRTAVESGQERATNGALNVKMIIYKHKEAPDEVKTMFKQEFKNHLFAKLQEMEIGECIEYEFNCEQRKAHGSILEDANDNLEEVLMMLPVLAREENYELPNGTYVGFTIVRKDDNETIVKTTMCSWITEAYNSNRKE